MKLLLFNLATDIKDPFLGFTTKWINALAKKYESIDVITMQAGCIDVRGNVSVYSVGKESGYSELRRFFEFYRILFRLLYKNKYDGCFSHMMPLFSAMAGPILLIKKIPLVTWYAHRQLTLKLKLAYFFSKHVVSINKGAFPYKHDKFIELGHGIDSDYFSFNERDFLKNEILVVGRISPIKDPLTLIEAMDMLKKGGAIVNVTWAGSCPSGGEEFEDKVKNKVNELGLGGQIHLAGNVYGDDLVSLYHESSVHINLCPDGALDKAVLEAFNCGCPSLYCNKNFESTTGEMHSELFFECKNARGLAEKITEFFRLEINEKREIAQFLRSNTEKMHSLEKVSEKISLLLGNESSQ